MAAKELAGERLVAEFRNVGLTDMDARRSAFCALAYSQGWSPARIGRYLDISRTRAGQRIDRLRQFVQTREDMPELARLLAQAPSRPNPSAADPPVAFQRASWQDPEFAQGLIDLLAA